MTLSMRFVLGDKAPAADAGHEQYVTARKLPCASPQLFIRILGVARPVPGQPYNSTHLRRPLPRRAGSSPS